MRFSSIFPSPFNYPMTFKLVLTLYACFYFEKSNLFIRTQSYCQFLHNSLLPIVILPYCTIAILPIPILPCFQLPYCQLPFFHIANCNIVQLPHCQLPFWIVKNMPLYSYGFSYGSSLFSQ